MFEMSTPLNNDFKADVFLIIDWSFPSNVRFEKCLFAHTEFYHFSISSLGANESI